MTMEEYLARFRLLQHAAEKDERTLALLKSPAYRSFIHRFKNSEDPVLSCTVLTEKALTARLEKRQRLCERYASRIARVIAGIQTPELKEYALYHFLYGLTHEEIAERSYFSVRTVYRHAKKAREDLRIELLRVSPKIKKIPSCKFSVQGKLKRRSFLMDEVSRSVAICTARRRGVPFSLGKKMPVAQ